MNRERLLDRFIEAERKRFRAGSGDDMFYEAQFMDYINKQRPFWINFIKFIEKELRKMKGERK